MTKFDDLDKITIAARTNMSATEKCATSIPNLPVPGFTKDWLNGYREIMKDLEKRFQNVYRQLTSEELMDRDPHRSFVETFDEYFGKNGELVFDNKFSEESFNETAFAQLVSTTAFLKIIAPLDNPSFMSEEDKRTLALYRVCIENLENRFKEYTRVLALSDPNLFANHVPYTESFDKMIENGDTFELSTSFGNGKDLYIPYKLRPIGADASVKELATNCNRAYTCGLDTLVLMKDNEEQNETYNNDKYNRILSACRQIFVDGGELGDCYRELLDADKDRLYNNRTVNQDIEFYKRLSKALIRVCLDVVQERKKYETNNGSYDASYLKKCNEAVDAITSIMNNLMRHIPRVDFVLNSLKSTGYYLNSMNYDADKFVENYSNIDSEEAIK